MSLYKHHCRLKRVITLWKFYITQLIYTYTHTFTEDWLQVGWFCKEYIPK